MEVKVIKAKTGAPGEAGSSPGDRLRVCAYCRVSTDSEEQETSYAAQIAHYTSYINANPAWRFAGIFADEGLSGTSVRKRDEFNRMIAACEAGEVDMVITKSISRFARNTLDCLKYIRKLKALKIPILFEKENINTMDAVGEVLITILASIAQQESKSISDNVRMGIEFGFQEGRGVLNYSRFLGYTGTGTPGELAIVPEQAKLVRRIFREYLEGYSPYHIAARLEAEGAVSATGGTKWYNSTIFSILRNEKYCGELLMQKYFTEDYLTHKLVKNTGQRRQYFVADHHAPIVPKEVFYQVQGEMLRRSALALDPGKLRFGNRLALNGRLICGKCGRTLKRYVKPDAAKTNWRCRQRAAALKREERPYPNTSCDLRIVRETEVQDAVLKAFNRLAAQQPRLRTMMRQQMKELSRLDGVLQKLRTKQSVLEEQLETPDPGGTGAAALRQELAAVERRRELLWAERAKQAFQAMRLRLLLELTEQLSGETGQEPETPPEDPACRDYEDFFRRTKYRVPPDAVDHRGQVIKFNNDMVTRYLENIIVEEHSYLVIFKAGIILEIEG